MILTEAYLSYTVQSSAVESSLGCTFLLWPYVSPVSLKLQCSKSLYLLSVEFALNFSMDYPSQMYGDSCQCVLFMPQIFGFILFLCCFLLFGFCWGFLCQHSMLMPNLSLKIFSLEHFIQELQGKKGTSIKVDNTRQLILGFPPSFAVLLVILPEEHLLFSETGTFICYLHRQCFL